MEELINDIVYCSLDLELSGFDPTKDEILELGFVFFSMEKSGPKILEEWAQVFKPTKPVHPKILGLTGLTQAELDNAPLFSEYHEFLNEKLATAILVGHGLSLDIKFLEAFGLKLSGNYVDTLDLVQFILPTQQSYNLENLMHSFAVPHLGAHRALADSHATIIVLEKLLRVYQGFPADLKVEVQKLLATTTLPWSALLGIDLAPLPLPVLPSDPMQFENFPAELPEKTILNLPLNLQQPDWLAGLTGALPGPVLLSVPHDYLVLWLWKQYNIEPIFLPRHLFDQAKFKAFLEKPDKTLEEIKFILKILVWRLTNWQTKTILDLNLSFFGGQFRSLITASDLPDILPWDRALCAYDTLPLLSQKEVSTTPALVVQDFLEFHHRFESAQGHRLSWGYLTNLLRSIYDPVTEIGNGDFKELVSSTLAAADLFFALVILRLQRHFGGQEAVSLEKLKLNNYVYAQIEQAAKNFIIKLAKLNKSISLVELTDYINALKKMFDSEPGRVKWIEARGTSCNFYDLPLDIGPEVLNVLSPYRQIIFSNNFLQGVSLAYLENRLGLNGFEQETISSQSPAPRINLGLMRQHNTEQEILKYLTEEYLPAVVVFKTVTEVKDFYNENYEMLKKYTNVFAQGYSGGGNKMFRNFGIRSSSILLVTEDFLFNNRLHHLTVKTIWFQHWFSANQNHPYQQALYEHWHKIYPEFNLLQQVLRFFSCVQMGFPAKLVNIYLVLNELDEKQVDILKNLLMQTRQFNILSASAENHG